MKDMAFSYVVYFSVVFIAVFGGLELMEYLDNSRAVVEVEVEIISPKQGVECVVVTTTDGAAVDCWRNL